MPTFTDQVEFKTRNESYFVPYYNLTKYSRPQVGGVLCFVHFYECIRMGSAILLFYTSDGFLIAADGRSRINGVKSNDEVTKIF